MQAVHRHYYYGYRSINKLVGKIVSFGKRGRVASKDVTLQLYRLGKKTGPF